MIQVSLIRFLQLFKCTASEPNKLYKAQTQTSFVEDNFFIIF